MDEHRSGEIVVLLICREGKSRQVYQAELDSPGVSLVCVQTLMEFFCRGVYRPLSGILVDMPTYMCSAEEDKHLLTDLVVHFPALRLKCNEGSGEIRTLPFGTAYPGKTPPAAFVHKYCAAFVPRKIRTSERSQLNLPALLTMSPPVEGLSGTRSVTADISCGGCFLVSFESAVVGARGWLTLPSLQDNAAIPVEVCWIRPWGEVGFLPGIGVRFIELTEAQKGELNRLGGRNFMS